MLHPLTYFPSNFPPKTLIGNHRRRSFSPFFSFPKPSHFTPRCSSSAAYNTLASSAIQRIADKLRSLGFSEDAAAASSTSAGEIFVPLPDALPKQRVGHTIDASWSTPETPVPSPGTGRAISRFHEMRREVKRVEETERTKKKEEKERVPTLAEMSLSASELRRLRRIGIEVRNKVGKAGITEGVVNGIHENWRSSEVVNLVCKDLCRLNMKRTHDLLEENRRDGGLEIGSEDHIVKGVNYKYPYFLRGRQHEDSTSDVPVNEGGKDEANSATGEGSTDQKAQPALIQGVGLENREIVLKLEQATGAVLVSQEPSKVILYRGWGAGDSPGNKDKNNTIAKKVDPVVLLNSWPQ